MSKGLIRQVVKERIGILLDLARKELKNHEDRSKRYIKLIKKLVTRYNFRLPKAIKRRFCKKCNTIWVHGYNLKVRLRSKSKFIEYICNCGYKRRFPLG
ncbi:ribonuclease P protein component 4 [Candidatus Micrarchaeota archaeon]|nr:ribonuclease P protein component 4 [Candidatus Micrarchaeota archaeon]